METQDTDLKKMFALDDGAGPAKRISKARADAIVQAALDQAGLQAARRVAPRRSGWMMWAAVAVMSLAFGAAALWLGSRSSDRVADGTDPGNTHPARSHGATKLVASSPAAAPVTPPPIASPIPQDVQVVQPRVLTPPPNTDLQTPPAVPEPPSGSSHRAQDLLRQANALRGERRWREASDVYLRAAHEDPQSTEACVAEVSASTIDLEQLHNAEAALRLSRDAIRRCAHNPLLEEARYGVAEAYRALGNTVEETRTLHLYLAEYPNGTMSHRATDRLRALEPDTTQH